MKTIKYLLTILLLALLTTATISQTRQELDKMPNIFKSEINGLTVYGTTGSNNELLVYIFYQDLLLGTGFSPNVKASSVVQHIENSYFFLRNFNNATGLYFDLKNQQLLLITPLYMEDGLRFLIVNIKEDLWK